MGLTLKEYDNKFKTFAQKHETFVELPTYEKWIAASDSGNSLRLDDPALKSIDALVSLLQGNHSVGVKRYLLGELFFTTMWWINNHKKNPTKMQAGRLRAIVSLNMCAANKLSAILNCPINGLAGLLRDIYGIAMCEHGLKADRDNKQQYLDCLTRERFRVLFREGIAYSYFRTDERPLDTTGNMLDGNREGYLFVLSLSGAFYAAPQLSGLTNCHSTFMSGAPVQCGGTISAKKGYITTIKNDSGHYKPSDLALTKVLTIFRTAGVNLKDIIVEGQVSGKSTNADVFLGQNGNWQNILKSGRIK